METNLTLQNGGNRYPVFIGKFCKAGYYIFANPRNLLSLISAMMVFIGGSLLSGTVSAQNAEAEKIKAVVTAETEAAYKADGNAWQSTWSHHKTTTRTLVSSQTYMMMTGWENFGPEMLAGLKASKPAPVKFRNSNYSIKTDGNLAWVEYDQLVSIDGDSTQNYSSHEYRVLEKANGQWKIVSQITLDMSSYESTENNFNAAGYKYLNEKKINEAIDVFLLNVKLHPDAYNTYDSLGEAYALAGQKELAIKNYERSLQLNPKNDNAKEMLVKLRK